MKVVILFSCLIAAAMGAEFMVKTKTHMDYLWDGWKAKYERNYPTDFEDSFRRTIWEKNVEFVDQHNAEQEEGKHSYTVAINQFSDRTPEEMMTGRTPQNNTDFHADGYYVPDNVKSLPPKLDWREYGYVTPVKDQDDCNCGWAFAATGGLEGQHAKITQELVSLSEQNLLDCSYTFGTNGCISGLATQAFDYICSNGGVDTEASYPYDAVRVHCRFSKDNVGASCTGFQRTPPGSEADLQFAVATIGPICARINANGRGFRHYSSGVYNYPLCQQYPLTHSVLVIGYGNESGEDYWLVKNSWGTSWGEQGYVKMSRNRNNQCGIASECSYPTV